MIPAVVALTLPAAAVWLILEASGAGRVLPSRLLRAAIALCVGIGLSTVTTYWIVASGTGLTVGFVIADAVLWVCLAAAARWWWRPAAPAAALTGEAASGPARARWIRSLTRADWLIRALFAVTAALVCASLVNGYLSLPHGDWDAWAIWNQKARFLFRGGEQWTDALAIEWSHPAHPLLVPLSVARLWAYAGAEVPVAPAMLGVVHGWAIVAVVVGGLGADRTRAWVAGAVLLAPSAFITQWTAQQADIPFALFMVATLVLLGHAGIASWRGEGDLRAPLLLAGVLASLGAWTKNEGMLLVCVTTLVAIGITARTGRIGNIGWWGMGLAPVLLTLGWFKLMVAPVLPYYLPEEPLVAAFVERFTQAEHRAIIDAALWHRWRMWGGPAATGAVALVTVAAACLALTRTGRVARELLMVPLVMLMGYYTVYLLTSLDVAWLIGTTFDRLLTQLWPSLVLAAFFVATPPTVRLTA